MTKFTPDPKIISPKKLFKSSLIKKKVKVTNEFELFKKIVLKRGSASEINGEIIRDITVSSMAHILSKKRYPKFRLREDNIVILTVDQHREYDQGSEGYLRTIPEWAWFFQKKEELLEEYKKLTD